MPVRGSHALRYANYQERESAAVIVSSVRGGRCWGLKNKRIRENFTILKDYYLSWMESKMLLRILPLHILDLARILSEGRLETLEEHSYGRGSKDVGWQIKGTE